MTKIEPFNLFGLDLQVHDLILTLLNVSSTRPVEIGN